MKKLLFTLIAVLGLSSLAQADDFSLSGAQFAKAAPAAQPAMMMKAETPAVTLFDGSGTFVQFQTGLDISFLDEIVNGTNGWKSFFPGSYISGTAARGGVASDLSYGIHLDGASSLALNLGNVLTAPSVISATDPSNRTVFQADVAPSLYSASLVYSLNLAQGAGSRIYFSLGGGWYHGIVSEATLGTSGPGGFGGTFTGDTVGGTLGLGGEIDLGSSFGLGFTVNGRYAYFSRVSADKAGDASSNPGPYSLTEFTGPGGQHVLIPLDNADINSSSNGYTAVDYSGIDAQFSLTYRFF
ncbi:MAG TPA: hypothetical protein VFR02_02705 [bacterium]|nr:hypothetical protein [bacterium]